MCYLCIPFLSAPVSMSLLLFILPLFVVRIFPVVSRVFAVCNFLYFVMLAVDMTMAVSVGVN